MNPFARTTVGLFVVAGPDHEKPLLADQVCAALIDKLYADPSRILDAQTWQNTVQKIPNLVGITVSSQSQSRITSLDNLPQALAEICTAGSGSIQAPKGLTGLIASYLGAYGEPTAVNCLIINQTDPARIDLLLTCLTITEGASREIATTLLTASLDLSQKKTKQNLEQIFSRYGPAAEGPYYLRIVS
jgi:hypothetical protein